MIEEKDVKHIANLARLELTDEEVKKFSSQLGSILEHVANMSELDTSKVKPTAHAVALSNVLREDKVNHEVSREKALSNAPEEEEGAFKVPRIV